MYVKRYLFLSLARIIAEGVWKELESKDIRDVVKVARLAKTIEDISLIIRMMPLLIRSGFMREFCYYNL